MTEAVSSYFFTLSNAAYRVSLHGLGAELEDEGVQTPPPPAQRGLIIVS